MRTALVTGGSRRIGAAIVRALAADGWKVVVHYHASQPEADALCQELADAGHACAAVQADLSRQEDVEGLFPRCLEAHGPIDCLVNNAATFRYDWIGDVTWESLHGHFAPNLAAPVLLSRDFAKQRRPGGCIVNILDQKIDNLNPDHLSYTLTKIALSGLTKMLAMALAPHVRVCGIAPGLTLKSDRQTEASFQRAWHSPPLGRSSTAEEIAGAARFILASASMTGQVIVLDGGENLKGRRRDFGFDPDLEPDRA